MEAHFRRNEDKAMQDSGQEVSRAGKRIDVDNNTPSVAMGATKCIDLKAAVEQGLDVSSSGTLLTQHDECLPYLKECVREGDPCLEFNAVVPVNLLPVFNDYSGTWLRAVHVICVRVPSACLRHAGADFVQSRQEADEFRH